MEEVLKIVVLGRAARNASNIKNRQPIGKMFVKASAQLETFYKDIIEEELNVKEVIFTDDVSAFTSYTFKPQLRSVGPKYGKVLGQIQKALAAVNGNEAMAQLKKNGVLSFAEIGDGVELTEDDLLITMTQQEGYATESDNDITVVLETTLSEELLEEGFVREIISKVQTMRKEAGFEVMDKIHVYYEAKEKAARIFEQNKAVIAGEVLADDIRSDVMKGYTKEWNINGESVILGVERS
jgi:isoleucyl-tRNA synthetase